MIRHRQFLHNINMFIVILQYTATYVTLHTAPK